MPLKAFEAFFYALLNYYYRSLQGHSELLVKARYLFLSAVYYRFCFAHCFLYCLRIYLYRLFRVLRFGAWTPLISVSSCFVCLLFLSLLSHLWSCLIAGCACSHHCLILELGLFVHSGSSSGIRLVSSCTWQCFLWSLSLFASRISWAFLVLAQCGQL